MNCHGGLLKMLIYRGKLRGMKTVNIARWRVHNLVMLLWSQCICSFVGRRIYFQVKVKLCVGLLTECAVHCVVHPRYRKTVFCMCDCHVTNYCHSTNANFASRQNDYKLGKAVLWNYK
ncbi:hypothetical protein NP493_1087g00076 [Ridgeia piscesae]|uniref:Uncharacterized protein n=1 Tax=Ridgeia piscesae TaxID=27915 RepID=A0AAD9KHJ9_RIDPI|nr:hypothetical protein NP493_1087g00076 [Ridgeia piscesae]